MRILKLEAVGFDPTGTAKAWGIARQEPSVARLTYDGDKVYRTYLRPRLDYSNANSKGTRGVVFAFELYDGIYQVLETKSWKSQRLYYLTIDGTLAVEITENEMLEGLEALYV